MLSSETLVLFVLGLLLLIGGAETLVRGASRLATALGISPLVVGLTVVAYGTSAPELAVTIQSTWTGQTDISVGNVVGSNILNVLLILGLSATIAPLMVSRQLVRLDVPLMIAVSVLLAGLAYDGRLGRIDGIGLVAGALAYTLWSIRQSYREGQEVQAEYNEAFGGTSRSRWRILAQVAMVLAGLALLVVGARWLVDGAVAIATTLGLSELIIGLTIVAVGTSLPEVATSIIASLRGERDIAVGNIVGSNIFNILLVLGLASLMAPTGINVSAAALHFDIPVMIAVAIACLPIFFTGHVISRWEGALFTGYYLAYTLYLLLDAADHDALPIFSTVMLLFVVPLTALTLVLLVVRALRASRRKTGVS